MSTAFTDVRDELQRATAKFPEWPNDPLHALGVVTEEFGELGKAVLQHVYEPDKSSLADIRAEAVQLAAMAIRFIESIDAYNYKPSEQHEQEWVAPGVLVRYSRDGETALAWARSPHAGGWHCDHIIGGVLFVHKPLHPYRDDYATVERVCKENKR